MSHEPLEIRSELPEDIQRCITEIKNESEH